MRTSQYLESLIRLRKFSSCGDGATQQNQFSLYIHHRKDLTHLWYVVLYIQEWYKKWHWAVNKGVARVRRGDQTLNVLSTSQQEIHPVSRYELTILSPVTNREIQTELITIPCMSDTHVIHSFLIQFHDFESAHTGWYDQVPTIQTQYILLSS